MSRELNKQLIALHNKIYDVVSKNIENSELYIPSWEARIGEHVETAIGDYLASLIDNEAVIGQLAKKATKQIVAQHKEKERAQRADHRKNLKLWNVTKGEIPCLNQCGTVFHKTEDEVLNGSVNIVCAQCYEANGASKIFETKTIYDIFGIK